MACVIDNLTESLWRGRTVSSGMYNHYHIRVWGARNRFTWAFYLVEEAINTPLYTREIKSVGRESVCLRTRNELVRELEYNSPFQN